MYRDKRLEGFDAAAVVEVIEHLDAARLAAFERVLFEYAKPTNIVLTTPNTEYNCLFPTLPAGRLRHRESSLRVDTSRVQAMAEGIATRFGYAVRFQPVGTRTQPTERQHRWGIFTRA